MEQAMPVAAHPTSAVPGTPTAAVTLWSSPAVDDSSRILRKGDLVRVAERYVA
jgi:2-keto-4-pentenoate hydratase